MKSGKGKGKNIKRAFQIQWWLVSGTNGFKYLHVTQIEIPVIKLFQKVGYVSKEMYMIYVFETFATHT